MSGRRSSSKNTAVTSPGTGTGTGTGVSSVSVAPESMELPPFKSKSPTKVHVEKVKAISELVRAGYYMSPRTTIFRASSNQQNPNLPECLKARPALSGKDIICFPGATGAYSAGLPLYIGKSYLKLQNRSPAFLYIRYYAHIEDTEGRKRNKGTKIVYVRPALRPDNNVSINEKEKSKSKYLPITQDSKWREEIVQIDIEMASKKHSKFHGFEIGALNFERGDYFLINRFVLLQGVEAAGLERLREEFSPDPDSIKEIRDTPDSSRCKRCLSTVFLRPLFWSLACCFTRRNDRYDTV